MNREYKLAILFAIFTIFCLGLVLLFLMSDCQGRCPHDKKCQDRCFKQGYCPHGDY